MRRFVGILIVFAGGVLALTALLGFSIDEQSLLNTIYAPAFEPALLVLLDSHRALFSIFSFAAVSFILMCSVVALAKGSTHMGFTIMITALCAGLSSWPRGTPFMLIVIFGAHWISVAEMRTHNNALKRKKSAVPPAPPAPPPPVEAAVTNAPPPENASAPASENEENAKKKTRNGFFRKFIRRFLH